MLSKCMKVIFAFFAGGRLRWSKKMGPRVVAKPATQPAEMKCIAFGEGPLKIRWYKEEKSSKEKKLLSNTNRMVCINLTLSVT